MKIFNRNNCASAVITLFTLVAFSSCSDDSEPTPVVPDGDEFVIVGGVNNPAALYMLTAGDVTTGSVSAIGNGTEITSWSRWFKNGYYYKRTSGKFSKYKYENKLLTLVTEVAVTGAGVNSLWLDDKTLLLENATPTAEKPILNYSIINVETMTVTSSGTVAGQALGATDNAIYIGSLTRKDSKLYISYALFNSQWRATDTAYLAVVDYPSFGNVTISKDTRSTYPGSIGVDLPSTLTYNNNIYILTNTGDRWGINANKPSAIYRIGNGKTSYDTDYFFDLSALSSGNREYYGLWDLGNGKALTRMGRKDLLLTFTDYTATDVFEYYVIDVVNKTRTKLDLPLDKGVRTSPVWVENGKAYIAVSSTTSGNFVYTYEISSGKITKGMEIKGVDYVNWISRFND